MVLEYIYIYIYNDGWSLQYGEYDAYDANSPLTFSPSALNLGHGLYSVDLVVTDNDNDNNPVDGWWPYYYDSNDWHGTRFIYVVDGNAESEEYVAYGEDIEIDYTITPDGSYADFIEDYSNWPYNEACVLIADPGNMCALVANIGTLSSMSSPPEYIENMEEFSGWFTWDGIGGSGPFEYNGEEYNGIQIPPGTYELYTYIECPDGVTTIMEKTQDVTVFGVTDVQWVTYGNNITLDDCPAPNGGKAIFPDKSCPGDIDPDRRKVYLEATITPPLPNKDVYFSWWDVDDPSTDYWPIDENGSAGGDNFGTGAGLSAISDTTDSYGKVQVTFTVTMRPGDNYRIAASTSQTQLNQMNMTMANNNSPPTGVIISPMLTTWRVLHVEFDTMEDPDDPDYIEPFGVINRTSRAIYSNSLVSTGAPYWPTDSLYGSVLLPTASNAPNIVNYVNEITFDIEHNTSNAVQVRTNYTADFFDNDATNGPDDVGEIFDMSSYIANPSYTPYSINTDDQPLSIPDLSAIIDGMNYYFNEAYIYASLK